MINQAVQKFLFSSQPVHIPLAIIGGGTGGVNVSAQLTADRFLKPHQIKIFDACNMHTYRAAWTMVGAGLYDQGMTMKSMDSVIYKGIVRVPENITKVDPEKNLLITSEGNQYTYEQLVISSGLVNKIPAIKGALEALEDRECPVATIYDHKYLQKMEKLTKNIQSGQKALFTEPQMPIRCPGAPQKITYLSSDRFMRENKKVIVDFHKTIAVLFGVSKYNERLKEVVKERGINLTLKSKLVEVRGQDRVAVFEDQETKELSEKSFDILHLVPPQYAPKFIADSGLDDGSGYVDVNPQTMQHARYQNIWALGDSANLPTSKTAAGVMQQTPILCSNIINSWQGKPFTSEPYDGYTCCPVLTSNKSVLLCEFKYKGEVTETFPFVQKSDNRLMYFLKAKIFPFAYWNLMPKGIWGGRAGLRWSTIFG